MPTSVSCSHALLATLVIAFVGCGSGDVGDGGQGVEISTGLDAPDVLGRSSLDTEPIGPTLDALPTDASTQEVPRPRASIVEDGEPCEENADCPGGWCVDGPDGGLCTSTCDDECDPGWSCQMVGAGGSDAVFICVPLFAEICRPCHDDTDCADEPGALQPKCLDYGPSGGFCGSACDDDGSCPVGYWCDEGQCRLSDGPDGDAECECTERYTFQSASTWCEISNAFGACAGERVCAEEGLTACDAPVPSVDVCDGVDNDCDGETDEDFVAEPTTCGSGTCLGSGGTTCVAGEIVDTCIAGIGSPSDTVCNGIDDDCDGETDEDYAPEATTCGFGACEATGTTSCGNGQVISNCTPGEPESPDDLTCDGVDQDCDGVADDDFVNVSTSCGAGACAATGQIECTDGALINTCEASSGGADDATCDGVDDDCDGQVDEDYVGKPTVCGEGACAATGATACVGGEVVNTCVPGAGAASDTTCDGVDDDCDGATDDEYAADITSCGTGACVGSGVKSCVDGEIHDSCVAGAGAASDMTCDGVDDDCDGATDEDYVPAPTACGEGACAASGLTSCVAGSVVDSCVAGSGDAVDATCDGVDDDCDGATDEDYLPVPTACGEGACAATGVTSCVAGAEQDSCAAGVPHAGDATCDGIDDDCNGLIDDGFSGTATACGEGACVASGETSCVEGVLLDSCVAGEAAATDASCDGVDDDCDGLTDEDHEPVATSCGTGPCAGSGTTSCVAGQVVDSCQSGEGEAIDASCDGIDNDCDGLTDEEYASVGTFCGVGACASTGTTSCVDGVVLDSCEAGAAAPDDATCDGVDDDCSGQADEDFVGVLTSCGVGACASSGATSCVAGEVVDSCVAAPALGALDINCDGVDDDCSGEADEDYVAAPTACGIGACAATGLLACVDGSLTDTCEALPAPSGTDASCDGIDSDCSGQTDEDYVASPTSCGVGACASTGVTSCSGGVESDSCTAGAAAPHDASCNGIDDDCSGQTDEDYVPSGTTCGTGACASSGQLVCVGGDITDTCSAGAAAPSDSSCNGVDDDCNGQTDEDFSPTPTSCGVGACASTGQLLCSNGSTINTCVPGNGSPSDATCNGIDDDCSGQTDEDYIPSGTTCGTGACAATGSLVCVNGHTSDTCSAGTPASTDGDCDGVDDDCDGDTDEDCGPAPSCDYTLSAGHDHVCAIDNEDVVHCWGKNSAYQVGQATLGFTYRSPQPVVGNAALVSCGFDHTCIIDKNSKAWCWGEGANGRLGNGSTADSATPVQVSGFTGWDQIDCGQDHCCGVLKAGGAVACWGNNDQGQLGLGSTTPSSVPQLTGLTGVRQVSAGARHTCAVTNTGTLFCWGINDNGQIGQPIGTTSKSTGAVGVANVTNAVEVGCGERSTCILESGGVVRCFGHNTSWQLGGPNPMPNTHIPTQVFGPNGAKRLGTGFDHHCATANGIAAICWGNGAEGEIGTGGKSSQNAPANASGMDAVTILSGGDDFTCAGSTNGQLKCWGDNDEGSLGTGVTTDSVLPAIVSGFTMAPTSSTCSF